MEQDEVMEFLVRDGIMNAIGEAREAVKKHGKP